jgi:hypothetical protein
MYYFKGLYYYYVVQIDGPIVVFITNSAYIVRDYLELLANFDLFSQNHL